MDIRIRVDDSKVRAALNSVNRAIPNAVVNALNATARIGVLDEQHEMRDVFERPTPWTLGGVGLKAATRAYPASQVYLKNEAGKGVPAATYLRAEISGGPRALKRFERALRAAGILPEGMYVVPGAGAKIDDYGNMSAGQINQILAYFRASQGGRTQAMSAAKRARLAKTTLSHAGFRYFVSDGKHGLHPGIWQAFQQQRQIRPIMLFVERAAYEAIYDFADVVERTVKREFNAQFAYAVRVATQGIGQ